MVEMHAVVRRLGLEWPSLKQWRDWAKSRFPSISAQSVQQTVGEFCENVDTTAEERQAQRKAGQKVTSRYPWRTSMYRDVVYTNQCAKLRDGILRLSHGKGGNSPLSIRMPKKLTLPGRIMVVTLGYGVIRIVCEVPTAPVVADAPVIGVDLGVNTLLAATDGETAILVSGREAKAIVQYRNKSLAEFNEKISRTQPKSRRRSKLIRAKYRMLERCARKIKDLLHKATRAVARAFPKHRVVVGKAFNDAARKMGRKQAQQVSQASNSVLTKQLDYKLMGAEKVSEAYSSQTCPGCGCLQKCKRLYRCATDGCGWTAPRDVVGCVNIRNIGIFGEMRKKQPMPTRIRLVRPLRKYPVSTPPGLDAGSSGGSPARNVDVACSLLL